MNTSNPNQTNCSTRLAQALTIVTLVFGYGLTAYAQSATQPAPKAETIEVKPVQQPATDTDDECRRLMTKLSTQVKRLSLRVENIERERRFEVTRVLLTGEEQRTEALQSKIRETFERQAGLNVKLEQLDQQLRPENIERLFIGVGSVRPEESRDSVRRRLTIERQSVLATLEAIRQERSRLVNSLAGADAAITRLRSRLADAAR